MSDRQPTFRGRTATGTEVIAMVVTRRRGAFSLIELVIVVVIIGIIGAIAIPRLSRGAEGAADAALVADLAVLRNAINLYAAEHGGTPPGDSTIAAQLTGNTDVFGATTGSNLIYGPYIAEIPTLKVGSKKGVNGISATTGSTIAWLYDAAGLTVTADLPDTEVDASGTPYNEY